MPATVVLWVVLAAIGLCPAAPDAAASDSLEHLAMGNPEKAVGLLKDALARHTAGGKATDVRGQLIGLSTEINIRAYLAEAFLRLGRRPEARQELLKIIELGDTTPSGYRVGGVAADQRKWAAETLRRLGE